MLKRGLLVRGLKTRNSPWKLLGAHKSVDVYAFGARDLEYRSEKVGDAEETILVHLVEDVRL
jgi:hypothetical protein